jgi:hypothetical protein
VSDALKDGRFVILGSLGEGAQGHTFDGVDRREGRAVAIKRFDVRSAKTWKDAELAEREARVLQSLSHPKLPRYFDHFEQDGALYLVMEKIDGESLAAMRKRGAVLSEADVVRLLGDASEVLEYLHGRTPPVIHRDLKPGNVLRRPDGSYAFVDFGAVRDKLRPDGGSTIVGTFGFMAPEQFQGRALPTSDVYAVGATALSMLTGRQPEELPHKGLAIDVRAALGGRVSARLVDALVAMLDPDPDRRPARIAPILSRLEEGNRPRKAQAASGEPASKDAFESRFLRRAEEYEQRAYEYERRAAEGGGSLARHLLRQAKSWHKGARKWRIEAEKYRAHFERHAQRRALRFERRAARFAERTTRPRAHGHRRFPPPVALVFLLAFLLATLAVSIATRIVVPMVLRVLSAFFAPRPLRAAAVAVREAGDNAVEHMIRSRRWLFDQTQGERVDDAPEASPTTAPEERTRVTEDVGAKVRVEVPGATDEDDALATDTGSGAARR